VERVIGDHRDHELMTFHGNHTNTWAIGVETGNLFATAHPPNGDWHRVSRTPAVEDIPGANFWVRRHRDAPGEVLGSWWTTANWTLPMREPSNAVRMLFSDAQYRSWALLGRFLAEQFLVPRNLPLLPWTMRTQNRTGPDRFRRILLADPSFDKIVAAFDAGWHLEADKFLPANAATLTANYNARSNGVSNAAWTRMIETFRGFHGHAFSGANDNTDHDCPGPLFDWHRFARELWDWWWFPFDLALMIPTIDQYTSNPGRRPYTQADGATPLIEYYFDNGGDPLVAASQHASRITDGILGPVSSPTTFRLDADSPVYAMANGELVAARCTTTSSPTPVSLAFALVRHEVFHLPAPAAAAGAPAVAAGRIDYDRAPSYVYSLYMHLETSAFDLLALSPNNPDWLNRVLIRHKECTIGVRYVDGDPTAQPPVPPQTDIAAAAWNSVPAGAPVRPSMLDGWRVDKAALDGFLATLRVGGVAVGPTIAQSTPIRVILGDFLGTAGVINGNAGNPIRGVRVETFSPSFSPPGFVARPDWLGVINPGDRPVVSEASEWARTLTESELAQLDITGVDPDAVSWWKTAADATTADPRLSADARLPDDGVVLHYRPLDFLPWLNGVTWSSEWSKYKIVLPAGAPVPPPRSRRV